LTTTSSSIVAGRWRAPQHEHAGVGLREGDAPLQEAPRVEVESRDEGDRPGERGHRGQQDVGVVESKRRRRGG
jgi:hypothetical protein